jgi:hypothetical protein
MLKRSIALLMIVLAILFWGCPKDDEDTKPANTPSITVTAPNGNETWTVNTSHLITWTSNNVTTVNIQFSIDGGTNWIAIATGAANTNSYSWTVPNTPATTCKVKVTNAGDTSVSGTSAANFTIAAASSADNASGQVRSDATTPTVIESPAGVRMIIPPGAVPPFTDNTVATQTFSIERTSDQPALPTGEARVTDVYRFGPEGFVFAAPVTVTIPMTGNPDSVSFYLYRTNPTSNELERVSAVYDPVNHTLTGQTYHFCCWFGTSTPQRDTGNGCIQVNNGSGRWFRICVMNYTLRYPEQGGSWMDGYGDGGLWAPQGTIGWASSGQFSLPQGTYTLCKQWQSTTDQNRYVHQIVTGVEINSAWNYWTHPSCQLTWDIGTPVDADTGYCNCVPTATPPVRTGDVQITMNWYVADDRGRDLDLHVFEPSGEEIAYYHARRPDTSATGGQLDQDITCGSYHAGVENIYWTDNPPSGEYIVKVHFFGNCSSDDNSSWPFDIRTVVRGTTRTFTGRVNPSETVEVTRFLVAGSTVQYNPPKDPPVMQYNLPPKSN